MNDSGGGAGGEADSRTAGRLAEDSTPPNPAKILQFRDLEVRFMRVKDRFEHEICVRFQEQSWSLLRSVEGTAEQPWPLSPPLQQLDFHELPGQGRAALMLGMAGRSHWSLSVAATPEEGVEFDVACRVAGPVERLGSCYRWAEGVRPVVAECEAPNRVVLEAPPLGLLLEACPVTDQPPVELEIGEQQFMVRVEPSGLGTSGTVRWRYRIHRLHRDLAPP